MLRLLALAWVLALWHLGTGDRRKGHHLQKRHGNRYKVEGGKRILSRAGGQKVTSRARSVEGGRKISSSRGHRGGEQQSKKFKPPVARKSVFDDDDDPFADDFGGDEPTSKEEAQRQKHEAKILRDMEKAEKSRVHSAVIDAGGLRTRDDLREEFRQIPNTFKRKDGLPGDEMADYLNTYFPELGIEDERDLIDFLAS